MTAENNTGKTNLFLLRKIPEIALFFRELEKVKITKTSLYVILERFFTKDGDLHQYVETTLSYGYLTKLAGEKYLAFSTRIYEYEKYKHRGREVRTVREVEDFSDHMIKVFKQAKESGDYNIEVTKLVTEYIVVMMKVNAYAEQDTIVDLFRDEEGNVITKKSRTEMISCWDKSKQTNNYVGVAVEWTENVRDVIKTRR